MDTVVETDNHTFVVPSFQWAWLDWIVVSNITLLLIISITLQMTCYSAFLSVYHGSKGNTQRANGLLRTSSSDWNKIKIFEPVVEIDLKNNYNKKYQIQTHCGNIENDHWEECVVCWKFFKKFIWYRSIEFIQWF